VIFAAVLRQARPPSPLAGRLAGQSLRFLEQHVPADVLAGARASSPEPEEGIAVGPPSLIDPDEPRTESTCGLIR
jgi:hypothetical protein